MNFETQALAVGTIRALRARAQRLGDETRGVPGGLARDYRALVSRAVAVTEETTWGEVNSIYMDYLEMTARYGLTPSAEMN